MLSRIHPIAALLSLAVLAACGDDSSTSPAPTAAPVGMHGITITAPNGGETFTAGDSITVKWSANVDSMNSANIEIQCGSAPKTSLYPSSVTDEMANWGSVRAKIPATVSGQCMVKISDYNMTWNYDTTDSRFTVNPR